MSVERHSDGRYRYRATGYYNDGTPCRISGTAPKTDNTRAAALKKEADHLAWLATQAPPADPMKGRNAHPPTLGATAPLGDAIAAASEEPAKPAAPTLAAFAPLYLASSRLENARSWIESKEHILKAYLVPRVGEMPLDQIDYAVIEDLKIRLSETRNPKFKAKVAFLAPQTINHVLDVLGHLLKIARKRGLVASVPEITRLKVPRAKWDFLTFDEAERLIAHADGTWRTMIVVALRTGLRRGELLGLRPDDIGATGQLEVVENYVRGQFKAPKSGKPRSVPLSVQARDALAAHHHGSERVFCDAHGKPFTKGIMELRLHQMCRRAGLRPIGWHTLRHTFASHLVMRGVPIRVVQDLMGHGSIVITQRYAHLMPHVSKDAVCLLDGPSQPAATTTIEGPTAGRNSRNVRGARAVGAPVSAKNRQGTATDSVTN